MTFTSYLAKNRQNILYFLILFVIIFASYWRTLFFPFVHDDFAFAERFEFAPFIISLINSFDPRQVLFYRPLSYLYMLCMYKLFGLTSFPDHLFILFLHLINSYLVGMIARKLIGNKQLGYIIGAIYAIAIPIHIDVLSWSLAGIQDLGGQLFFLLTILSQINGQKFKCIIYFMLSLLFKESTIILLLILFAYSIMFTNLSKSIFFRIKEMRLFAIPLLAYVIIKSLGTPVFKLPSSHPYYISFKGWHITYNIVSYLGWMAQSIIPYQGEVRAPFFRSIVFVMFLTPLLIGFTKSSNLFIVKNLIFLYIWFLIPLCMVIFLPNHTYRYYATYSFPAVLILFGFILNSFWLDYWGSVEKIIIYLTAIGIIGYFMICSNFVFYQGIGQRIYLDGTNLLIPRAAMVKILQRDLPRYLPNPPDSTVIVFKGLDLGSINYESGIKLFYKRTDIRVIHFGDLKKDENGYYVELSSNKNYIDDKKVFIFKLKGKKLKPIRLANN